MNKWDYRVREYLNKPATWAGGAVLTGAIMWAGLSDDAPVSRPIAFPTNETPIGNVRVNGGLAPGEAYSGTLQDSLAMLSSGAELPDAPEPSKTEEDPLSALNEIAEKNGSVKPMRERGVIPKLKAAFSSFTGSSGSGPSMRLSAPDSKALVKLKKHGAGSVGSIQADREFKSTAGGGLSARDGAVRENGTFSAGLSRAADAAGALLSSLKPGTATLKDPSKRANLDGGSPGGDKNPGVIDDVDGKEIKKDDKKEGNPPDADGSPQGMQPPGMGAPGGSDSKEKQPPGGDGKGEEPKYGPKPSNLKTGVSDNGLSGDLDAARTFGNALKQAGDSIQITPMLWTDGSSAAMSAAGDSKAKVGQISPFDPTDVNTAAKKGESVSSPPAKTVERQDLLDGVTNMKIGKTAEAELIVKSGYDSFEAAISQAHAYEESLKKSAKDVLETSDKTKAASEKIFQHKQTLKRTEDELNGLKEGQLKVQKTSYDGGDSSVKTGIAKSLETPIQDYNGKAQSAVSAFSAVETSAQSAKTDAEKTNAAVDKNFYSPTDGQIKKYADSLAVFDTNINVLNAKLQASKNSLVGGESNATALSTFRTNMETALQNMRNGRQTLGNLKEEYDAAAESVTRASLGVPEAWNGKSKTN